MCVIEGKPAGVPSIVMARLVRASRTSTMPWQEAWTSHAITGQGTVPKRKYLAAPRGLC
jgi:antirestriction protein ArdC